MSTTSKISTIGSITRVSTEDLYSLELTCEELSIIQEALTLYGEDLAKDYNRTSLNHRNVNLKRRQLYVYNKICNLESSIAKFLDSLRNKDKFLGCDKESKRL